MTFSEFRAHSEPLFKKLEILKFSDSIAVNNCLFVYDFFNKNLPHSFTDAFFRADDMYEYATRKATSGQLYIPRYKTTTFGLKSIYKRCIDSWNYFSNKINIIHRKNNINNPEVNDIDFLKYSRTVLRNNLTKHVCMFI